MDVMGRALHLFRRCPGSCTRRVASGAGPLRTPAGSSNMLRDRRITHALGAAAALVLRGLGVGGYWHTTHEPPERCPACAADSGDAPAEAAPAASPGAPTLEVFVEPPSIPDEELVDQVGRPVRFYSDLVRDKV